MAGILTMILAGGEGTRLYPLTEQRAKPAVPFGGNYRIIDFVLNNFVNSDLLQIYILTQFKSHSLMKHLRQGWRVSGLTHRFIDPIPAQMRTGKKWYEGTADAIYQNINLIEEEKPDLVCVFGADHVYKMDVRKMIDFHRQKDALLTVGTIPVPIEKARSFGVVEIDDDWRMVGFQEKPKDNAKTIPGTEGYALASIGNYIFDAKVLVEVLKADAFDPQSNHDFGKDIIPSLYPSGGVYAYDFYNNEVPGMRERERGYWRDVGTIDEFWQAHMDLVAPDPIFDLYNQRWPMRTFHPPMPPPKFVHNLGERRGQALNSMVSSGSVISGGTVEESVLGYNCHVHSYTHIKQSVLMGNVDIGENCRISRAIIDKEVTIGPNVVVGEDLEKDRQRFFVSPGGVVVIPKGSHIVN